MGSNSRNVYELKAGANKLEEVNMAFELMDEALATVSAGSGQDIYLYSELSKNYAVMPFNENVYDPVHDITTTDFSSYHWSVVSQTYASDAAAQYALAAAEAVKAEAGGTKAELEAWEAEAEKKTADSYATQPYNEFVIVYTSNGDGFFTETPTTEYSSLHHAEASQYFADLALSNSEAINFTAGMVTIWNSDRKPSGWLWCDGVTYGVFSPTPSLAYDELYQVLDDPTYVMTLKPSDWDDLYPLNPNGWYNPNDTDYQSYHDQSALPDTAELSLTVTVPDYRGMFLRAKDRAGSTGTARGIDTHGIVDFGTIVWSQNKAHTHILSTSYLGYRTGNGPTDDNDSAGPDNMTTVTLSEEGGAEGHGTYQTVNYIIRTKGVYNGTGGGSGGSGVTPIASEIDYADTHGTGLVNLQETTDEYFDKRAVLKIDGKLDETEEAIGSFVSPDGTYTTLSLNMYAYSFTESGDVVFCGAGFSQKTRAALITKVGTTYSTTDASNYVLSFGMFKGLYSFQLNTNLGSAQFKDINTHITQKTVSVTPHFSNTRVMINANGVNDNYIGYGDELGTSPEHRITIYDYDTDVVIEPTKTKVFSLGTVLLQRIEPLGDGAWVIMSNATSKEIWRKGIGWKDLDTSGTVLGINELAVAHDFITGKTYFANRIANSPVYEGTVDDNGVLTITSDEIFRRDLDGDYRSLKIHNNKLLVNDYPSVKLQTQNVRVKPIVPERVKAYTAIHGLAIIDSYALGKYSFSLGIGSEMAQDYGYSVGMYPTNTAGVMFEVGIGADTGNKADGFLCYTNGDVQAPNRLAVPNATSLLTKDIADGLYNNYAPTGFTGSFLIANGDTVTVVDGLITTVAP